MEAVNTIEISKQNIQQELSGTDPLVLIFISKQNPASLDVLTKLESLSDSRFRLAKVDCDIEVEIASYFQIQEAPTVLVFIDGSPVDGFAGDQELVFIKDLLDKHLPPLWESAYKEGVALLAAHEYEGAKVLLKDAYLASKDAKVALSLADVYLNLDDIASAQELLSTIKLADQDSYYASLISKLKLAQEVADTPEMRQLQDDYNKNPDNLDLALSLAKALHAAKRDEEALSLLFSFLQQNLQIHDGKVKELFLEIIKALGQGNTIANQFRRKLYTLMY